MKLKLIFLFILSMFSLSSFAAIFDVVLTINGQRVTKGYHKVEDVIDAINAKSLLTEFPSYNPATDAVSIAVNFRGLPMTMNYSAGGTVMTLSIPDLGITQTFSGADRDASNQAFKDWLKKSGGATLDKILKKLAEVSPNDPVAGNPNSLMTKMVNSDFSTGQASATSNKEQSLKNAASFGVSYGKFKLGNEDTSSFTLPMSYEINFANENRLTINLPFTYVKVGDAQSFSLASSFIYTIKVTDKWKLSPGFGTGIVGSVDLGSMGQIVSGSITSDYIFTLPRGTLNLTNMAGRYETIKIKVKDYSSNPKIQNTVIKNGLLYSLPHPFFFNWKAESEFFITDTRFLGDKLYMQSFQEFGASIGSDKSSTSLTSFLRFGATYLYSKQVKGYMANFGYSF